MLHFDLPILSIPLYNHNKHHFLHYYITDPYVQCHLTSASRDGSVLRIVSHNSSTTPAIREVNQGDLYLWGR